ncbi:MAG: hypothetical protein PHE17_17225 [Thiothrix sp.]|uniref:hypothetical protein n=1 Tax=Thiothrix sp. TaxID=1032 RepID=UPI0026178424|nr:hypothetical protein [Thiothrix sp.]MDD5394761.1 hypothetical protein [Thiothrix sp.]
MSKQINVSLKNISPPSTKAMKKQVLLALSALFIISTNACWAADDPTGIKVKADIWAANGSKYTETASAPGSNAPHGTLDTNFLKLSAEKSFGKIHVEGVLNSGNILKQKMYLDQAETDRVDIDGDIIGGEINGYYRMGTPSRYLDAGVGYLHSKTTKEFYNHTVAGVPDAARQGNFGNFKMTTDVLAAKLRGRTMRGNVGVEGSASYGPAWNSTTVTGWAGTTHEKAKGYNSILEGAVIWTPRPAMEVKAGYRDETLYFDPPSEGKHDLDIKFKGFFVAGIWQF